jgi:hypothetical protein
VKVVSVVIDLLLQLLDDLFRVLQLLQQGLLPLDGFIMPGILPLDGILFIFQHHLLEHGNQKLSFRRECVMKNEIAFGLRRYL